jgi:hypothetical protein
MKNKIIYTPEKTGIRIPTEARDRIISMLWEMPLELQIFGRDPDIYLVGKRSGQPAGIYDLAFDFNVPVKEGDLKVKCENKPFETIFLLGSEVKTQLNPGPIGIIEHRHFVSRESRNYTFYLFDTISNAVINCRGGK